MPAYHDLQYRDRALDLIFDGHKKTSRGGAISSTRSLFGTQMKFDLQQGFPLLTTKKINFKYIYHELMWFLRGETNIATLKAPIWNEWADDKGELGEIYGHMWRRWGEFNGRNGYGDLVKCPGFDQIKSILKQLKESPDSRRMVVSTWNPMHFESEYGKIPTACHSMFQVYVYEDVYGPTREQRKFLELHMYQRSADWAVGVPYNIASYALLTHMLAQENRMIPSRLVISFGDAHVYEPHVENLTMQIGRKPKQSPALRLSNLPFWDLVTRDDPADFDLIGYDPHPFVKYGLEI